MHPLSYSIMQTGFDTLAGEHPDFPQVHDWIIAVEEAGPCKCHKYSASATVHTKSIERHSFEDVPCGPDTDSGWFV